MGLDDPHSKESESAESGTPAKRSAATPKPTHEQNQEFPVVGIGASAGGLAAFEQLFMDMPPDSGMAFVVVQHLSPPHKSILPEIIQRYTSMPVSQVINDMEVKPNSVYVIPPGRDLALRDGHLMLLEPKAARGHRLPIDFFFRSLAEDQGPRAIGIVLSGTGSDGSLGLSYIKAEGGLTIAQDPDTAEFGDMPRNAIATQDLDFILPARKMGELILRFAHHQILEGYKPTESDFQIPKEGLQKLYYLVCSKTGHDFSLYKQNTLLRRIERRMKITLKNNLDGYIDHLQEHPEEIDALFREMLIHVTHFFRDPEAFQALVEKTLRPLILRKHATRTPVRVWVAGCSSGEEAYSIAIAIQEVIDSLDADCPAQIFATDLDAQAIQTARRGFYLDGSLEYVSAERLQRFFHQENEGYQVKKPLRDRVIYSIQNLISDPPFSKIDLVCCRNVLIYLDHELQKQLILQFHYSLNPEGILFLGNSESITGNADLFAVVDRKHKIFQRKEAITPHRTKPRTRSLPSKVVIPDPDSRFSSLAAGELRAWVEKALLKFHTPSCVVIDEKHNILFIHGRTGKYLEPVPGETTTNLVRMAREGLKTELATAIQRASTRKEAVRREGVQVKTNGDYQVINLTIRPLDGPPEAPHLIMVVFEDAQGSPDETTPKTAHEKTKNRRVVQLERELKEKDDYLHSVIDELEDTNQDLKSANEELQSSNEEMQSTNEELETSKEELQSINEELTTINAELQNKNEELTGVNNDIYNLLASTEIGTVFLDLDLQLRRFTPAVLRLYNFLPTDIGRPISHFVSRVDYPNLVEDIQQVVATLVPKKIEAQANNGLWYLINIKPYRTLEQVIDGAVITFVDITEQKRGDDLRRLGIVLRDSNDAVTVQDFRGKILAWNRGASQLYGWSEAEALTMSALDLTPEDKRAEVIDLYQRLSNGEIMRSFETQRVTRSNKILDVWITLTALVDDANRPVGIATTERDISLRKQADRRSFFENRALKALYHWYSALLTQNPRGSWVDEACRILVEDPGYRLAWIGRVDNDHAKNVSFIASRGLGNGDPDLSKTTRTLAKRSQRALENALRSGHPVAMRNLVTDPAQEYWRAEARRHNYGSFLVLPLLHRKDPRASGVLVIYATEPEAFDGTEVKWLSLLSESISQVVEVDWKPIDRPAY